MTNASDTLPPFISSSMSPVFFIPVSPSSLGLSHSFSRPTRCRSFIVPAQAPRLPLCLHHSSSQFLSRHRRRSQKNTTSLASHHLRRALPLFLPALSALPSSGILSIPLDHTTALTARQRQACSVMTMSLARADRVKTGDASQLHRSHPLAL
ncbi:hypothetical protein PAXRUDRAFT_712737 [Paxillus rubicundulus Ve08.2h10]|uniref:Uncharacterized protein n=1 Tax=Paxillus rubicundulus Ve08.2h10 TaxID=930991 RepID=A0A0D0EAS0_9AGAM|nr:hypothetical protein PAXRUDRAFT_712737 [Paxillus rubicundulus Ve08.2h10]